MKLYTEEQVKKMLDKIMVEGVVTFKDIIDCETLIELPSDKDIENVAEKTLSVNLIGFITGAKWMKEQILGKEDKTFKQKSKWTKV
jgi:hypothetical protein